jgi:hypothetical protein
MNVLEQLPTILTFSTLFIGGFIAIWGLFDQKLRQRNSERDTQEDRIINLYKDEVSVMRDKLGNYDIELKTMRSELSRIGGENRLLRDLVTGKDKDTAAWRIRTEESMHLTAEIAKLAVANGTKLDAVLKENESTNKNIERLAVAIENHLQKGDTH